MTPGFSQLTRVEQARNTLDDLNGHLQAMAHQLVDADWNPQTMVTLRQRLDQQVYGWLQHLARGAGAQYLAQPASGASRLPGRPRTGHQQRAAVARCLGRHRQVTSGLAQQFGAAQALSGIRTDIRVAEAFAAACPVRAYAPNSRAAPDLVQVSLEINRLWV